MFARESDMAAGVARWLRAAGMTVRSEFTTPWGLCDLVGLRFNQSRVTHRVGLKQTRAVGSIARATLLLSIPDVKTRKAITLERLVARFLPSVSREILTAETERLVSDRFVIRSSRGGLQKVNGWMPLHDRLVAVELKLARVDEAMHQGLNNLGFADESYVGFPSIIAQRIASNSTRWSKFFEHGVGLLSVARRKCEVLIPASKSESLNDKAVQLYCVEKFWRTRLKGN